MTSLILRLLGGRFLKKAIADGAQGSPLDIKFGFALLRNRQMPLRFKLLALGLGGALIAALIALEIPVESLIAVIGGPIFGPLLDLAADGLEVLTGPVLIGALILPHIAPAAIVNQLRAERYGVNAGPVIDIQSHETTVVQPAYRH